MAGLGECRAQSAKTIGMGPGTLAGPLGCVMYYCALHKLPPLTALVVRKSGGRPGVGLTTSEDVNKDRERVYGFNWFKRLPPSAEELSEALRDGERGHDRR